VVLALALPGLRASGRSPRAACLGTKGLAELSNCEGHASVRGENGLASIRERRLVRSAESLVAAAGNGRCAAAALRRARGILRSVTPSGAAGAGRARGAGLET